jgi:hypothetical protein
MAELPEEAEAAEDVYDFGEFSWNEPSEARRLTRGEELTVREHEGLMWLDAWEGKLLGMTTLELEEGGEEQATSGERSKNPPIPEPVGLSRATDC